MSSSASRLCRHVSPELSTLPPAGDRKKEHKSPACPPPSLQPAACLGCRKQAPRTAAGADGKAHQS